MPPSFPYVIIGGGNSSGYCLKTLLEDCGIPGTKIALLCGEKVLPYERPALTKAYLHHPDAKVRARLPGFHTCVGGGGERQTMDWYKDKHGMVENEQIFLDVNVNKVDIEGKKIYYMDHKKVKECEISYGKLFIATGCNSFNPNPSLFGGSNVYSLRNEYDASCIVKELEQGSNSSNSVKNLVIIGGGYIGLEVAAAVVGWKNWKVTILNLDKTVMMRAFADAPEFASMLQESIEKRGGKVVNDCGGFKELVKGGGDKVRFDIKELVTKEDSDNMNHKVTSILLNNGTHYPADLVVLGMGAKPSTSFLDKKYLSDRGYVKVNQNFQLSNNSDVYAIGDLALFPLKGNLTVLEHVAHARASAKHAALASCDKLETKVLTTGYDILPFFYSRMFEYSEKPLIWNMWGEKVAGSKLSLSKCPNGLVGIWVNNGTVCCACLMLTDPAPTNEQLDAVKSLIGQPESSIKGVVNSGNGSLFKGVVDCNASIAYVKVDDGKKRLKSSGDQCLGMAGDLQALLDSVTKCDYKTAFDQLATLVTKQICPAR